mgnify:FL=1
MFDSKKFFSSFPKSAYDVTVYISRQGFCLTLVGGAVRDFLLDGIISKDLDFEIKHLFEYDEQRWERMLLRMFTQLEKDLGLKVENKGHNVFSITIDGNELEFSSPRVEKHIDNDFSHKNFEPSYISNLDYQRAFKRRDFTINAMGIFFGVPAAKDEFTLIDPFNGLSSISTRELKHVGEDFSKDPVRLLRLIRFKNSLNFNISMETQSLLSEFNLESISNYYLRTEFIKSKTLIFFKDLADVLDKYEISTPGDMSFITELGTADSENGMIPFSIEHFFAWLCLSYEFSSDTKRKIISYFGQSLKNGEKLIQCSELYRDISKSSLDEKILFMDLISSIKAQLNFGRALLSRVQTWNDRLANFRPSSKGLGKEERIKLKRDLVNELF